MPFSQSDLDNIDAAIAASELKVEVDGKSVLYRSIAELMQARAHIASVITAQSAPKRSTFYYTFTTQRGD